MRTFFLVLVLHLIGELPEEFHIDWVIWTLFQLFQSFGVKAASEVLAEGIKELVIAIEPLVARAIKDVSLVGQVAPLACVLLRDLPNFLDVNLLLQVLFHEVFELKRFVIQTLSEIFAELVCELRKH